MPRAERSFDLAGTYPFYLLRKFIDRVWQTRYKSAFSGKNTANCGVLESLIRSRVIPALTTMHNTRAMLQTPYSVSQDHFSPQDIEAFWSLLLDADMATCEAFVLRFANEGVSLRSILLDLFSPTVTRMQALCDADELNRLDVSLGVARLGIIAEYLGRTVFYQPYQCDDRCLLLIGDKADCYSVSMLMAEALFRSNRWQVTLFPHAHSHHILTARISESWFKVAGLCAATLEAAEELRSTIKLIRRVSLNKDIFILVSGEAFLADPLLAQYVGADAVAADAGVALNIANAA
jgi:MerR family transcriptional regulator, light-induced transcriptional regulator